MVTLNQVSNIAFVIGAIYAWYIWRQRNSDDKFSLLLIVLLALIGIGSFIYHAFPSDKTIWIDLIPIQIFGLSYFAYLGKKYFELSNLQLLLILVAFFFVRQYWIIYMPRGAIGGGITHIPTVFLLLSSALLLLSRYKKFSTMLLIASAIYILALVIRAMDKQISVQFPVGVHWIWHILTALTASMLILATILCPASIKLKD